MMKYSNQFTVEVMSDLKDLIPGYLEKRNQELALMTELNQIGDFDKIGKIAHNLKGNAGGYGFDGLGEIAQTLEKAVDKKDTDSIKKCLDEISNYLIHVEVKFV